MYNDGLYFFVGCTHLEPYPGWLDTINGPSGIVTGVTAGLLRTIYLDSNKITDIIPVDYTVNALISVMWDTVNSYQHSNQTKKVPKIYNYVSSNESPITWGEYIQNMYDHYFEVPPLRAMWYIFCIFHTNFLIDTILRFWLHKVPGALMDLLLIISGKTPKMLKMYSKTENTLDMLNEFLTREWFFDNENTKNLWLSLSKEDRNIFWFSLEKFDWKDYLKIYYFGVRKHILHEDLSNTKKAVSKNQKLFWLHCLCIVLIIYLLLQFLYWIFIITMKKCITDTFRDGVVFITGSMEFLRTILLEKLLRSCDIKTIAVLVRSKKGLTASRRAVDICKQDLRVSTYDYDWMINNVNFVFHCSATIKFNETLQAAIKINVQGTEKLLELSTRNINLKGFVHVSTAYSHCPRSEIKEYFYPVSISTKELKDLIKLGETTQTFGADWLNTYTFTKALTENVILTNENQLSISIFCPSIIRCTQSEPEPSWLDNINGVFPYLTYISFNRRKFKNNSIIYE
ncbi:hypothetical protein AGLY_006143 [Aphis glycines]|uniref:Fatty acyl-CoA reductase n=1 Tax=Aphis glycines TaxID=307491 RepID=A0A6G0TSX5_APHGL|nr:hypothetical protein AGLY_006143 [Aphis glycines]